AFSEECPAADYCTAAFGGCGKCQPRARTGDSCTTTPCRAELTCARDRTGGAVCVPWAQGADSACGSIQSGICPGHLQCVSRVCKAPAKRDEACDPQLVRGP